MRQPCFPGQFRQATVLDLQASLHAIGDRRVMRHDNQRDVLVMVQGQQQIEYFARRCRIEIAGGFVCEDQRGLRDECAGNGDALPLATRKIGGAMLGAVAQPDTFDLTLCFHACRITRVPPVRQWQCHIVERAEAGEQIETLEDEADDFVTRSRTNVGFGQRHVSAFQE
ncbi:hypothetical protein WL05_23790 [Burkholderia ubonensis]|nr:hypothetical protein WJ51_17590 [Burkholderia ubonensis]KVM12339.1 hypothetical protein WJ52_20060 [Burkholderia ubonensis]KVM46864.1 hypothetical protein WJ56_22235 [Burkholderia ubonensis]KVX43658.1 hypothetical protein WL05_23790 [Burkholderia ubonensis]KVX84830.1 hypothetical protein WL10_24475 [Burkholderia ubonensis]